MKQNERVVADSYRMAQEAYGELGINTEEAMSVLDTLPISLHCWQGDDVGGFEAPDEHLTGGIMVTGVYPGKSRNADELLGLSAHEIRKKHCCLACWKTQNNLVKAEQAFNYTDRLVLLEELKPMPVGAVWDYYCLSLEVPVGRAWLEAVRNYETRTEYARK